MGNQIEDVENDQATKLAYVEGNRLARHGDKKITLDARGNLIDDGERRFEYNTQNRPISFYKNGKLSAQYHYNPNGLRDSKTQYSGNALTTTRFTYAPDTRLLSAGNATQITHYIWLGAAPVAQIEKPIKQISENSKLTQIIYLHTDHLLTPRVATNDQQKIVWRWQSDAFGETLAENDPDKDGKATQINLRFPGQYADEESGLYYNVFRYYDPQSGRYTQSDPIGLGGGLNSFAYVGANPLSLIDILGLKLCSTTLPGMGNTYLDESFDSAVQNWIALNAQSHINITFNEGFRSTADQANMAGNTNAITPAPPGNSLHEAGYAVDINWSRLTQAQQRTVIANASSAGISWGGNFHTPDPVHFYIDPGNRAQLIQQSQSDFTDGTASGCSCGG